MTQGRYKARLTSKVRAATNVNVELPDATEPQTLYDWSFFIYIYIYILQWYYTTSKIVDIAFLFSPPLSSSSSSSPKYYSPPVVFVVFCIRAGG